MFVFEIDQPNPLVFSNDNFMITDHSQVGKIS